MSQYGLGGFHQHTAALGDLLTSLYRAGSAAARSGPDDPSPGITSMRAVMERLDTSGLTNVISVDQDHGHVLCQARCSVVKLAKVVQDLGWWPHLPPARLETTVGAAVLSGSIPADRVCWLEVLTTQGQITRCQPSQLPPDSLVLAVCLSLEQ